MGKKEQLQRGTTCSISRYSFSTYVIDDNCFGSPPFLAFAVDPFFTMPRWWQLLRISEVNGLELSDVSPCVLQEHGSRRIVPYPMGDLGRTVHMSHDMTCMGHREVTEWEAHDLLPTEPTKGCCTLKASGDRPPRTHLLASLLYY